MLLPTLRKMTIGSTDQRFEITKRLSDYVGVLTRILFLSVFTGFIGTKVDNSAAVQGDLYAIGMSLAFVAMAVLNLLLNLSFAGLTTSFLLDIFVPEYRGVSTGWRKGLGLTVNFLSFIVVVTLVYTMQYMIPKVINEMARDEVAKHAHVDPLPIPDTPEQDKAAQQKEPIN